jgi:hypothetical protein
VRKLHEMPSDAAAADWAWGSLDEEDLGFLFRRYSSNDVMEFHHVKHLLSQLNLALEVEELQVILGAIGKSDSKEDKTHFSLDLSTFKMFLLQPTIKSCGI